MTKFSIWQQAVALLPLVIGLSAQAQPDIQTMNAQLNARDNYLDYLVQDVCVNAFDKPTAGDPASCSRKRNLRIGERVPYIMTDYVRSKDGKKANDKRSQGLFSYPVPGNDNVLKVLVSKNGRVNVTADFNHDFAENRDGYDLIDTAGHLPSAIRTFDPSCKDQLIELSQGHRNGGWPIFPRDMSTGSTTHNIRMTRLSGSISAECRRSNTINGLYQTVSQVTNNSALTAWNAPANVTYESGKNLRSVVVYHFAQTNTSQTENALERFFFTREYGFTKWEAWVPLSRCHRDFGADSPACNLNHASNSVKTRCNPSNGQTNYGGQTWIRLDCRDSTFYLALKRPQIPLTGDMARTNNVHDVNLDLVYVTSPDVFDAHEYLAANQDLNSAFRGNISQATSHWINHGLGENRLGRAAFHTATYLGIYGDIKNYTGGKYVHAIKHYIQYGQKEGRVGRFELLPQVFSANTYLAANKDLLNAFGSGNQDSARTHWLTNGIFEGRRASNEFHSVKYLNRYVDLRTAFGKNYLQALHHYLQSGKAEGRKGN